MKTTLIPIFLLTISLSGCGQLIKLIDLQVPVQSQPTQNVQTQPVVPTQNNQPQNNQPIYKKYITPIITVQRMGEERHDAKITWTYTGAISYTVERTSWNPKMENGWEEIAEISSGFITVKNAYYSGIHYYRVKANYEDDIVKTSLPMVYNPRD